MDHQKKQHSTRFINNQIRKTTIPLDLLATKFENSFNKMHETKKSPEFEDTDTEDTKRHIDPRLFLLGSVLTQNLIN